MDRFSRHYKKQLYAGRKKPRHERRRPALCLPTAYMHSPKPSVKQAPHRVDFDLDRDDDTERQPSSRDNRRNNHNNDLTLVASGSFDGSEAGTDLSSEGTFFHWEEGSTLLSELMKDGPTAGRAEDLDALVDSLQSPFDEQGKILKQEIADTLVLTNNQIKSVSGALKKNVDGGFYQGLSAFDRACKNIELCSAEQQTCLRDAFENTQEEVQKAFAELERKYAEREQLWDKLFEDVDAIVVPVLEYIQGTPARAEEAILKVEKRAKALENEFREMNSFEKGFQGLFRDS